MKRSKNPLAAIDPKQLNIFRMRVRRSPWGLTVPLNRQITKMNYMRTTHKVPIACVFGSYNAPARARSYYC